MTKTKRDRQFRPVPVPSVVLGGLFGALGGFQTGIHQKAYRELIAHLGLKEEIVILDAVQQLAKPSEAVLERFHVDTRYICAKAPDSFKGGIVKNTRNGRLWHDLKDEFGGFAVHLLQK